MIDMSKIWVVEDWVEVSFRLTPKHKVPLLVVYVLIIGFLKGFNY